MDLETKVVIRYQLLKANVLAGKDGDWDEVIRSVQRAHPNENVREVADQMSRQGAFSLFERKLDQIIKSIANTV